MFLFLLSSNYLAPYTQYTLVRGLYSPAHFCWMHSIHSRLTPPTFMSNKNWKFWPYFDCAALHFLPRVAPTSWEMYSRSKSRSSLNVQRMFFVSFLLIFFRFWLLASQFSVVRHGAGGRGGAANKWETKMFAASQILINDESKHKHTHTKHAAKSID